LFDAMFARLSRGLAASALLCAVQFGARGARADDQGPTLLAYKAPADCPAVGDFQRSVQRRSTRIRFVDEGSHDRELSIILRKDGDFVVGELRLIEQNGTLRQRSVRFNTCAEAVEGLALIATVSLDPQALLEAPGAVSPTPSPATATPTPTSTPPNRQPPARPESIPPTPLPSIPDPSGIETNVGAEFNVYFRALPEPAFGGGAFMDVGAASRHLFSPLIHAAITHVEQLGFHPTTQLPPSELNAEANFALTLVTLAGCPLRLGNETLVFRPCATASVGDLRSWSTQTDLSLARDNWYLSWGGSGMLLLRLGEIAEIVGDAGVGVTPIPYGFRFDMTTDVFWTTPRLYISSGLGFRLRLP
jgi:hypothetical protein